MSQKRVYKPYSRECKEETVALVRAQGYTILEAAKFPGIGANMLSHWQDNLQAPPLGQALGVDERTGLKRLRQEGFSMGRYGVRR